MAQEFKSRVYTDRPPYADFDSPEKFEATFVSAAPQRTTRISA